jgi:hypothetical protein
MRFPFQAYTLDNALSRAHMYNSAFYIAYEINEIYIIDGEEKKRTREYYVFEDVHQFVRMMDDFPHSHEIVIDKCDYNKMTTMKGRLIFDFDLKERLYKGNYVSPTFEHDMEKCIMRTFDEYYRIDISILEFIWLDCENPKKFSKHLVVKNAFFSHNWVTQMKQFYKLLIKIISNSEYFNYCDIRDIIDEQVAKTNTTLRMPLCKKIGGNILTFRDNKYSFFDGLIDLHLENDMDNEQHISTSNVKIEKIEEEDKVKKKVKHTTEDFDDEMVSNIMKLFKPFNNDTFDYYSIAGNIVNLIRLKAAPCLLSGINHDNENAFILADKEGVKFFCRRGCKHNNRKHIYIKEFKKEKKKKTPKEMKKIGFIMPFSEKSTFNTKRTNSLHKKEITTGGFSIKPIKI